MMLKILKFASFLIYNHIITEKSLAIWQGIFYLYSSFLNGNPKFLRYSFASSLFFALVTTVMENPNTSFRSSSEVSGISLGGEVLLIQRIQESTILTSPPAQGEMFGRVPGSKQTQINLLARADYPLSDQTTLRGLIGVPLLQRKVNTDGLKRMLTLSAGLAFSF